MRLCFRMQTAGFLMTRLLFRLICHIGANAKRSLYCTVYYKYSQSNVHLCLVYLATTAVRKKPQVFFSPKPLFLNPNLHSPSEDSNLVFNVSPAIKYETVIVLDITHNHQIQLKHIHYYLLSNNKRHNVEMIHVSKIALSR